jgi:hypothetical protein
LSRDTLTHILELARWAPSGDNTQPWRFEIVDGDRIRVFGFDTRDHILYDYDGHASHIAHGALLETIRIAASGFSLDAQWSIVSGSNDRHPVYDVRLTPNDSLAQDRLFSCIQTRSVQRRPMKTSSLTVDQRQLLTNSTGPDFRVQWKESAGERWHVAQLLWYSAGIRLTCPEAYPVHSTIIEWRARFSKDRIPEQAVGVDPATARLMEWALGSWDRVSFLNRYLLGTVMPRVQLDLIPGFFCAAHALIQPRKAPKQLSDWINLGVAVQRFWLATTSLGLHMQPQMTPVIFRWYARSGRTFSSVPEIAMRSTILSEKFEQLFNAESSDSFGFFARVGHSNTPNSRSTRKDLEQLMIRHVSL